MIRILQFFNSYAVLIYLFLITGLIFAIRSLVRARREMGASIYKLERETAHQHVNQAVAGISLVLFLAVTELVLLVFLSPNMPAYSLLVTSTMDPLVTSTSTVPPEFLVTIGAGTPLSTPTAQTTGCIPGQIMITSPKPGDVIKGLVVLSGTVDIPNFGFYKYEYSPFGSNGWSTIQADRSIKQDQPLGNWDTSEITPGDYNLRLVVTDNQGNSLPACIVPLRVAAP